MAPMGKGTYGSKVGSPPKKKKVKKGGKKEWVINSLSRVKNPRKPKRKLKSEKVPQSCER